jgi:flagellar biosynthetic protein FliP
MKFVINIKTILNRFGGWIFLLVLGCVGDGLGLPVVGQTKAPVSVAIPEKAVSNGIARIHDKDFKSQSSKPVSNWIGSVPTPSDSRLLPLKGSAPVENTQNPQTFRSIQHADAISGFNGVGETGAPVQERPKNQEPLTRDFVQANGAQTFPPTSENVSDGEGEAVAEVDSIQTVSNWSFDSLKDRKTLPSTIQMIISIASISLVPAFLLMTTCFIRIVVVLGILRQAIGLQQLPPTQVTTALALMLTFLIMAPTWNEIKQESIDPYSADESTMSWEEAWNNGVNPVKKFMWGQIREAENENDFWVFYDYLPDEEKSKEPESFDEVQLKVMLPAFMISELKVAFLIGVQILLPFLILDIVVASFCNTMGLIMLPPAVVSLPLKLLLFVMVDGWNLIVGMLLNSFVAVG